MAKKTIAERLAQLEAQKKTLQARLAKQERAQDTRRKVLLGAFLLHRLENDRDFGPVLKDWVRRELPGFLVRPDDKTLFAELLTGAPRHRRRRPLPPLPRPLPNSRSQPSPTSARPSFSRDAGLARLRQHVPRKRARRLGPPRPRQYRDLSGSSSAKETAKSRMMATISAMRRLLAR